MVGVTSGYSSFNTASGKHCCNAKNSMKNLMLILVSIPQAVSTVATYRNNISNKSYLSKVSIPQAVSTVATYGWSY